MRRFPWWAVAALLVAVGALAWYLSIGKPSEAPLLEVGKLDREQAPGLRDRVLPTDTSPKGGVYDGLVVDDSGRPIGGARILLVRYETGEGMNHKQFKPDGSDFDPAAVPIIGGYEISGETRSEADGRFRVAAGETFHRVKLVVAWTEEHAPAYVPTGAPGELVKVVLTRGGFLKGLVVDPTGQPVPNAQVHVYQQQIAPEAKQPQPGQPGVAVVPKPQALAAAPLLGDFLGRIVGPRVYGVDPAKTEALVRTTRADGTFHLGPFDGTVQLQVVVHHPDYVWMDFDEDETGYVRRPVLKPGQTLERTYQLQVGNWIEGRVVGAEDGQTDKGIGGVLIRVRHPVAYKKHIWYEHRTRNAITNEDGTFRVAGLSHGPFVADLFHPSFGSHFEGEIPANTRGLVWAVPSRGGIDGIVEGLTERPLGGRIDVVLEPLEVGGPTSGATRTTAMLSEKNTFLLERLTPGRYRVSVRAGLWASAPLEIMVEARKVAHVSFEAMRGGSLRARVQDGGGRAIDPATLVLLRSDAPAGRSPELGTFLSRAGLVDEEGVAPGTYRLEVSAPGYLPTRTEPFEVKADGLVELGTIVLARPGAVRFGEIRDESGRSPTAEVRFQVKEGAGEWRVPFLQNGEVRLRPGPVSLKAEDAAGRTWSVDFDLGEGETRKVDVTLRGG